jgi:hypothetical protein
LFEVNCASEFDVVKLPIVLTVIPLDGRAASARIVQGDLGPRLIQ